MADESANIPEAEISPPFSYQWNWKHKKNLYFVFWSLIFVVCSKCSQLLSPLYITLFSTGFCLNKGAAQSLGPNIYFAHHFKSACNNWWLSSDLITTDLRHRVNLILIVDKYQNISVYINFSSDFTEMKTWLQHNNWEICNE